MSSGRNQGTRRRGVSCSPDTFFQAGTCRREDSLAYLLGRPLALMNEAVNKSLEPKGLTYAQWIPLLKLHRGEASTVAELGRACQIDAGAMTRTLDRLEAKGLVLRVRSVEDRRVVHIELTTLGRETVKSIPAALSGCTTALLSGFTNDEWQLLNQLLGRLVVNAEELLENRSRSQLRS